MPDDFSVIHPGNIVQADLLKCLLEGDGSEPRREFLARYIECDRNPSTVLNAAFISFVLRSATERKSGPRCATLSG